MQALFEEVQNKNVRTYLHIGAFVVIRKILQEYKLDKIIDALIGRDSGLFLDLAEYTLVTEGNVAQYYPEYAFNHPLFTVCTIRCWQIGLDILKKTRKEWRLCARLWKI